MREEALLFDFIPIRVNVGVRIISLAIEIAPGTTIPLDILVKHYLYLRNELFPSDTFPDTQQSVVATHNMSFSLIVIAILWGFGLFCVNIARLGRTDGPPVAVGGFMRFAVVGVSILYAAYVTIGVVILREYLTLNELCIQSTPYIIITESCRPGEVWQLLLVSPFFAVVSAVIEGLIIWPNSSCIRRRNSDVTGLELSPSLSTITFIRVPSITEVFVTEGEH